MEKQIIEAIFVIENEHFANKEYRKGIEDTVQYAMGWEGDVIIKPLPRNQDDGACSWTHFCMRPTLNSATETKQTPAP